MRITVIVKPNARQERVERLPDGSYRVAVHAPPTDGKANERLLALVAAHFNVRPSAVSLVHGATGRRKLIEVLL
ncbi:MAG: DUF167 domain-containing protein [Deltaproteobacteria bacterium]|nr:DUF167 domain-containing protein [Deltaproteobacteria bacterium]